MRETPLSKNKLNWGGLRQISRAALGTGIFYELNIQAGGQLWKPCKIVKFCGRISVIPFATTGEIFFADWGLCRERCGMGESVETSSSRTSLCSGVMYFWRLSKTIIVLLHLGRLESFEVRKKKLQSIMKLGSMGLPSGLNSCFVLISDLWSSFNR